MKVLGFGEILMRLCPEGYNRLTQVNKFNYNLAGAELNVCVNLSNLGVNASFLTKLPDNEIKDIVVNELNKYKIDSSNIIYGGDRLGLYFTETGASQRPSKVIYDRKYSSISASKLNEYDFDKIFDGINLVHITGITPALSKEMSEISIEFLKEAKKRNIITCFDFNFRKKLWSKEEGKPVLLEMLKYTDYLFGLGLYEAENILDIDLNKYNIKTTEDLMKYLVSEYNLKGCSITLRTSISASTEKLTAIYYKDNNLYKTKEYTMEIVDRIGGGDAFTSGLIYSIINNYDNQKALDFAIASSVLKHSILGDFNLSNKDEIEMLMNSSGNGRINR